MQICQSLSSRIDRTICLFLPLVMMTNTFLSFLFATGHGAKAFRKLSTTTPRSYSRVVTAKFELRISQARSRLFFPTGITVNLSLLKFLFHLFLIYICKVLLDYVTISMAFDCKEFSISHRPDPQELGASCCPPHSPGQLLRSKSFFNIFS